MISDIIWILWLQLKCNRWICCYSKIWFHPYDLLSSSDRCSSLLAFLFLCSFLLFSFSFHTTFLVSPFFHFLFHFASHSFPFSLSSDCKSYNLPALSTSISQMRNVPFADKLSRFALAANCSGFSSPYVMWEKRKKIWKRKKKGKEKKWKKRRGKMKKSKKLEKSLDKTTLIITV